MKFNQNIEKMKSEKIISEEILRIKEIMGINLNEAEQGPGPWYIRLVDELTATMNAAGKSTTELQAARKLLAKANLTGLELDSAIYNLFKKTSSYYPELINYIRTNYASKIDEAAYEVARLGKQLKDNGASQVDIEMGMRKYYNNNIEGGYFGDDIAEDVLTKAKAEVDAHVPIPKPTPNLTEADAEIVMNDFRNKPEYKDIFKRYGAQLEAEYKAAVRRIINAQGDLGTFSKEMDNIILTWQKNHPYIAPAWWRWAKKIFNKIFVWRNKLGESNYALSLLKTFGSVIGTLYATRIFVRMRRGEGPGSAAIHAFQDDIVGTLGALLGLGGATIDEIVPPDPIKPGEVEDIKSEY